MRDSGFAFHYKATCRRRHNSAKAKYDCTISCDAFPDFLDTRELRPSGALGRAPISAFLTIANHSCSGDGKTCGYRMCPKRISFQTFATSTMDSLDKVVATIDQGVASVEQQKDLVVARRLQEIASHTPLALVDGRFATRMGELEQKYAN